MRSDRVHRLVITAPSLMVWLALIIAGSARPSEAQTQKNHVVITVSTKDLSSAPVWLAERLGYFKKEGLESRIVVMRSDLQITSLISGDADFAGSLSSVTKAAAVGVPVKIVMSFFNGSFFYLVTKPEITDIKMLSKKTIAISRYGSATDFDARAVFKHFSLEPGRDITILAVGGGTNRLASLVSGRVDAAILTEGEKGVAEKAGMKALLTTGQFNKQPVGGLGASVEKIRTQRDFLTKSLRAVYRAMTVMKNDKNAIKDFFDKELAISAKQFDGAYESMLKVFLPNGEIQPSDLTGPYEDARKAATNPPPVGVDELADWSLLRTARSSVK
jgi:ABC-type nitrate/sulfonate/bicarbonate transport system substrate-binding protein